jgi:hypothetical protein
VFSLRLGDTTSSTGDQLLVVLGHSLLAPAVVAVDKYVQLTRQRRPSTEAVARSDVEVGA